MCSRKKEQLSENTTNARTNGDDLRRALDWILNNKIFADLKVHGNVSWTGLALVRLAVFWVWSAESSLVAAANDAIACVIRIFGESAVNSYQALTDALKRYSDQLIPILWSRIHKLMQQCDEKNYRIGLWLALAVDGSRLGVPRTAKNEHAFCKPRKKGKKSKKAKGKKRGRLAKRKKRPTHKKKHYDPQEVGPQMWLTMIWHMSMQLPWCWKIGPSYASERDDVLRLLQEQIFPEYTLFCGDAGFVGYNFWRSIQEQNHHFLVRVGGNVRLLKSLGYIRGRNDIVYSWPNEAMKKKYPPLVLRLLHFKDGRNNEIYLVTNVLDKNLLPDKHASQIFRQRWGIEVQFRTLKQTYGRTKLRSRTPERAEVELHWSLIGLSAIQLLAHKEQTKFPEPNRKTSIAAVLRVVRRMMQHDAEIPKRTESFPKQLAQAVTDNYKRKSKKKSRNYPRRKEEPAPSKPVINKATKFHIQRLKEIEALANAA
jgi:hypothetical protein